ncbi:GNAT family N-acetyltransferase [Streptomyces sp. NPDC002588]|uniref:GNAT family N-acetyltransferase n=1 Tax=Streptomyces sp. NPDC002588 TaxID=3154419 RepID=UPI003333E5FA
MPEGGGARGGAPAGGRGAVTALAVRLTGPADLGAVTRYESDPGAAGWLGVKGLAWHERALADPDQEHLLAEVDGEPAGFVVLAGLRETAGTVELRRIVVGPAFQGRGLGRRMFRTAVARAHGLHGAHRVWLDVKPGNVRARALYTSEGFIENGTIAGPPEDPEDLILMIHDAR